MCTLTSPLEACQKTENSDAKQIRSLGFFPLLNTFQSDKNSDWNKLNVNINILLKVSSGFVATFRYVVKLAYNTVGFVGFWMQGCWVVEQTIGQCTLTSINLKNFKVGSFCGKWGAIGISCQYQIRSRAKFLRKDFCNSYECTGNILRWKIQVKTFAFKILPLHRCHSTRIFYSKLQDFTVTLGWTPEVSSDSFISLRRIYQVRDYNLVGRWTNLHLGKK